jgi:hypothetical protein
MALGQVGCAAGSKGDLAANLSSAALNHAHRTRTIFAPTSVPMSSEGRRTPGDPKERHQHETKGSRPHPLAADYASGSNHYSS